MSQFDFLIMPNLFILTSCVFILVTFVTLFTTALVRWVEYGTRLLVKNELICETEELRRSTCRVFSSTVLFHGVSDLMEQFLANTASLMGLLVSAFAFFFPSILVVAVLGLFLEILFEFVFSLMKDIALEEIVYFARNTIGLVSIFTCLVVFNVFGLIPFSYTVTSSLVAPLFFSITILVIYTFTLVTKYKLALFAGFLPSETNIYIAPLIVLIEILSTGAKFISLGVRLFANMFAGHLLLKVFYSISFKILLSFSLLAYFSQVVVVFFLLAITSLELMIAFLQSFVLLLLTVLYLKEAENFILAH